MVSPTKPTALTIAPGIQRDGTLLTKQCWTDGQWVRFYDGRPKKMAGRTATNNFLNPIPRALDLDWRGTTGYLHSLNGTTVDRVTINSAGVISAITNRTPAGFAVDPNNTWHVDRLFDEGSNKVSLIAHATNNLEDIGAGVSRPIYYGDTDSIAPLTDASLSDANAVTDGGIVVAQPYIFAFGSDGEVKWCDANDPANWTSGDAGSDRITNSKIVTGRAIRSGSGTGAVFWSLENLILARYVGGSLIFDFSVVARDSSILSPRSVVEVDGIYYWPGIDSFNIFDGSQKRILENTHNKRYFFDGLNYDRRMCVWGYYNSTFEEIYWFYPRGAATECTHYIALAVGESRRTGKPVWFDGQLARSAGFPAKSGFRYPLLTDTANPAILWQHEIGVDEVNPTNSAIQSYIESNTLSLVPEGTDQWVYCDRLEWDGTQTGDMTLTVRGRKYPRGSDTDDTYTVTATDQKTDFKEQRRYMRMKLESNVVGGNYELGKVIAHLAAEDATQN